MWSTCTDSTYVRRRGRRCARNGLLFGIFLGFRIAEHDSHASLEDVFGHVLHAIDVYINTIALRDRVRDHSQILSMDHTHVLLQTWDPDEASFALLAPEMLCL